MDPAASVCKETPDIIIGQIQLTGYFPSKLIGPFLKEEEIILSPFKQLPYPESYLLKGKIFQDH